VLLRKDCVVVYSLVKASIWGKEIEATQADETLEKEKVWRERRIYTLPRCLSCEGGELVNAESTTNCAIAGIEMCPCLEIIHPSNRLPIHSIGETSFFTPAEAETAIIPIGITKQLACSHWGRTELGVFPARVVLSISFLSFNWAHNQLLYLSLLYLRSALFCKLAPVLCHFTIPSAGEMWPLLACQEFLVLALFCGLGNFFFVFRPNRPIRSIFKHDST
jgi:hypothetical protein